MWPWTTKTVLSRWGIFVAIVKNTLYGSKFLDFSFMPKIIRILGKDDVSWRYFVNLLLLIYQLNFWLVICITKNLIWTTLKAIFSIFWFCCTFRFQIIQLVVSRPNHTSMGSLFNQISDDVEISILKNWHLRLVLWSRVTYIVET